MTMPNFFEAHESGAYFHGTKADLAIGDLLTPGHLSNYEEGRVMNHIYVTKTLVGAGLAAMMAKGEGRGHVYIVEPEGTLEDDPNVTDKKFPGNPTHSYRSREPVRIVGEVLDWEGPRPNSWKPSGPGWPTSSARETRSSMTDRRPEAMPYAAPSALR
ncbi:rifampin ADP-ribosyl transferase [Mycobacteroides abscessus MAB_082312_2258]|uniref:Rifampin ADP-ribosyl transferase n=2 Tax=Mycobacteroides abscessus TaxID=36809 RepID=A0A829MA58_9MYCO|nr:rifampin ADP-ribosyl transferase [Mycobacteroides abscessus MAB_082312_2258]ESV61731.1 rifampin ADP-ribosyl transferase [Mycobacteroides abscessus MAB_091912_2446]